MKFRFWTSGHESQCSLPHVLFFDSGSDSIRAKMTEMLLFGGSFPRGPRWHDLRSLRYFPTSREVLVQSVCYMRPAIKLRIASTELRITPPFRIRSPLILVSKETSSASLTHSEHNSRGNTIQGKVQARYCDREFARLFKVPCSIGYAPCHPHRARGFKSVSTVIHVTNESNVEYKFHGKLLGQLVCLMVKDVEEEDGSLLTNMWEKYRKSIK